MNHTVRTIHALLAAVLILLSGCHSEEDVPAVTESLPWTAPKLNYGVLEYEKLDALPWYSGRAEGSSFDTLLETETGYYVSYMGTLYYMEKDDPRQWFPVCSKPDCSHGGIMTCDAMVMPSDKILMRTGRIYYATMEQLSLQFDRGNSNVLLLSMMPNGTDRKLEYTLTLPDHARTLIFMLTSDCLLCNVVTMNPDGTKTAYAYSVTQQGQQSIKKQDNYEGDFGINDAADLPLWGDRIFWNGVLDESAAIFYDFSGETVERLDLDGLPLEGSYLSGTTLRFFRANDGYYDRNILTGEEVKLADAQMNNSSARIVLPNCIIESTLFSADHTGIHSMIIYDGTAWRAVELPKELSSSEFAGVLTVKAITSERILFSVDYSGELFSIPLNDDQWRLEYYSTVAEGG